MRIVVTGAAGFIGKNLCAHLRELKTVETVALTRATSPAEFSAAARSADVVVHLAGVNRPTSDAEFAEGNVRLTQSLCDALATGERQVPVLFASSTRAGEDTRYGASKASAERVLQDYAAKTGSNVALFRLPNVFGKWCRPNYNSAVATFCHNIARGLPITVHAPDADLNLAYVDDVVSCFMEVIRDPHQAQGFREVSPVYTTKIGLVADTIRRFRDQRAKNLVSDVGGGLLRALYATYVSYLPVEEFSYRLKAHEDQRGAFSEFLKTPSAGQVSVFTARPGVTRGGHYHHTKTEKFLVVQGDALFCFRHILTGATLEVRTDSRALQVVETVPGWAHDVTNVGSDLLICCLWANECFDPERPDTYAAKVQA